MSKGESNKTRWVIKTETQVFWYDLQWYQAEISGTTSRQAP